MVDSQLDILIRILTQEVGADRAADILKKTTAELKGALVATQEHTKHTHEFRHALNFLSHSLGAVGHLLKVAFVSSGAAAIGAIILVLVKLVEHFRQLREIAAEVAKGVPQDMAAIERAVHAVRAETDAARASVKSWEDAVTEATDNVIKNMGVEKDAILTNIKARLALAVAAGADSDAMAARLKDIEAEFDLQEKSVTLAQRQNELAATRELLDKKEAEAKKNLAGLTADEAKERIAFLNESSKGLQAQLDSLKKLEEKAKGKQKTDIHWDITAIEQQMVRDAVRSGQLQTGVGASVEATGLRTRFNQRSAEVGRLGVGMEGASGAGRYRGIQSMMDNALLTGPSGGPTASDMKSKLDAAVASLAESKMLQSDLIRLLTNIFRDGVVTPQELVALQEAVKRQMVRDNSAR